MTNVTGFLLRTSLSDNGSLPRSGNWTGCPDICVSGTKALDRNTLISQYNQEFNADLTQTLTNNIYVRAKNMNSTALTQSVFLFQVPGSLVLRPQTWYSKKNLVCFVPPEGDPTDPRTWLDHQTITAGPNGIAATNAFTWSPDSTEHHCLVAVAADSWDAVLADYPQGVGTQDDLAKWIYSNGSLGWHNVNIKPITSTVYEDWTNYTNDDGVDEKVTFTMMAANVPVGARISFSSNSSTQSGEVIGQDWTTVPAPPQGGDVNPDFEIGSTITVNANYQTIITYRTDFNGKPVPNNFSQSVRATVVTTKPQAKNLMMARFMANDTLVSSFARAHSNNTLFRSSDGGEEFGSGLHGYLRMMAAVGGPPSGGGDHRIGNQAVVVIGSNTTRPNAA